MAPFPEIHKTIASLHADVVQRYVAEPSHASQEIYPPPNMIPTWGFFVIIFSVFFVCFLGILFIECWERRYYGKKNGSGGRKAQAFKESKPVQRHAEQIEGVTETGFK